MSQETAQMKDLLRSAERSEVENDGLRPGMAVISCAASELINTGNFSNITVGPIKVMRVVVDDGPESLKAAINETQALCEAACAEERQTVVTLLRANASAAAK